MRDSDKARFTEIMFGLADNFGDEINKFGLKMRFQALMEYSIDQVEKAALNIIKSRKYSKMPTIAEFIEDINGKPDDVAELQADIVMKAVRMVGSYRTPSFDDPVTSVVISHRFGWSSLCRTLTENNRKWFVQEFKDAYLAYQREKPELLEAPKTILQLADGIGGKNQRKEIKC